MKVLLLLIYQLFLQKCSLDKVLNGFILLLVSPQGDVYQVVEVSILDYVDNFSQIQLLRQPTTHLISRSPQNIMTSIMMMMNDLSRVWIIDSAGLLARGYTAN